ncbi:MAG: ATP-binding protein [Actinobacteria bacterium]|nr:ATP-binding protein [Actinomycetota bacterium]
MSLAVRHDPASAAVVRHSIAYDLGAHGVLDADIADVVLVASELVGNAVVHAAARHHDNLDVTWELEADAVVIRVRDGSADVPEVRRPDSTEASGRGLAIVAALARDWGVRRDASGKQVWARIPISFR